MYAKSFLARASRGRLTSAVTAKTYPYDRYACHLCQSALLFHPEWGTDVPWFEHPEATLTGNGRRHCPYVLTTSDEQCVIQRLRRLLTGFHPMVSKADWFCQGCHQDYHGERYCLVCRTGNFSTPVTGNRSNTVGDMA